MHCLSQSEGQNNAIEVHMSTLQAEDGNQRERELEEALSRETRGSLMITRACKLVVDEKHD